MKQLLVIALVASSSRGMSAQSSASAPKFEITSVRATPPERQNRLRTDFCTNGGRFVVGGAPVIWSIRFAYRLKDYQVFGAPAWLDAFDSAYDIRDERGTSLLADG